MKRHRLPRLAAFTCILFLAAACSSGGDGDEDAGCVPATACPVELQCGAADDGCGGQISCGTCDGLGEGLGCIDNACVPCTPAKTCATEGRECGDFMDDCGNIQHCGQCGTGAVCSGKGACVSCTPKTCGEAGENACGKMDDGCGGTIDCGCPRGWACADGKTCSPCEEHDCAYYGAQCGQYDEGCGWDPLFCGECSGDLNCVNNRCTEECVPASAAERCALLSVECGDIGDGCGGTVNCGRCTAPQSCQPDHTCGCVPLTCEDEGVTCGSIYDGCGNYVKCGADCKEGESEPFTVRIMTGNLTSGKKQTYDDGKGIRIFKGLKPQVALVQEFNFGGNTAKDYKEMVSQAFGENYYYVVDTSTDISIPNGVVSYYPIVSWGVLKDAYVGGTRNHVWARIDIPGESDLWVVSVHLNTTYQSRLQSVQQLRSDLEAKNIPAKDFIVIGGDFNTSKFADGSLKELSSTGLVALDTSEAEDFPIDQQGNGSTNAKRKNPLDGLYTSQNLKDLRTKMVIGKAKNLTERGLVFDSSVFTPLSAVEPVQASDSAEYEADGKTHTNMQHMAVVKDFAIPR